MLNMKLLLVILFATVLGAEEMKEPFEMKIAQGKLRGFKEISLGGKQFYSFLGIPFAKPPTGELRFEDPVPADPWTGTLEADSLREMCIQFDMLEMLRNNLSVAGLEDCLYLNVYTPKPSNPDANLPVMVFIHGGGYASGSAREYPPYVLLNEDIVLVTIQYRLNILGFLSTEDSSMGGNYGLKDQVIALKWVQKNILQFGGDPDRVTIFGESAGGGSVHFQVLSPLSAGLFNGAISQSGVATCPWGLIRNAREMAQKFGQIVDCPLEGSSDEYKKCLRNKDAKELVEKHNDLFEWGQSPMYTLPRVDGDFLPDEPLVLLKEKRYNKVNFISGVTKDEGIMFLILNMHPKLLEQLVDDFDRVGPISMMLGNEKDSAILAHKIYDHYLEGRKLTNESFLTLVDMFTDRFFSLAHDLTTKLHSEDPEMKTYRYQFNHRGQVNLLTILNITQYEDAVSHGDELFYIFQGGSLFGTPLETTEDLRMREVLVKLWTNFAATGDPTPDDSLGFRWTPATPSEFNQAALTPNPSMSEYVNTKARDFFDSLPLTENFILRKTEKSHSRTPLKEEL